MKRITWWAMSTLTLLVLLFSYRTSTEAVAAGGAGASNTVAMQQNTTTGQSEAGSTQTTTSGSGTGSGSTPAASASTSGSAKSATYTGTSVDTRWGPVQVRITVANGKVTSSEAIVYPSENSRDQEINSVAIPTLNSEAMGTTTSSIDMVSGATYTSTGYIQSLQSALDQAHI